MTLLDVVFWSLAFVWACSVGVSLVWIVQSILRAWRWDRATRMNVEILERGADGVYRRRR